MNLKQIEQLRGQLLTIYTIALESVNGEYCTRIALSERPIKHTVIKVVAVGKAAQGMMNGAMTALGDQISSALVITKQDHCETSTDRRIEVLESDHPIPSARSLFAGERLLAFVQAVKQTETLLFLISGGTSALVEVLNDSVSLEQLVELNNGCISRAYSIKQINTRRKSVSKIKAGGLLNYINTKQCIQLTISDVQNNDLSIIGSGLLVADNSLTEKDNIMEDILPAGIRDLGQTETRPSKTSVLHHIVADNRLAREAIKTYAQQQGWAIQYNEEIYSEVRLAARQISEILLNGDNGLYIWGGECVITLSEQPGQGGRCQSLALAIAEYIAGEDIVVLVVGTDGSDGPGEAAGALIDGLTLERGETLGLNLGQELAADNAGYYLSETGDLIDTGPTDTNVMDLIMAFKC